MKRFLLPLLTAAALPVMAQDNTQTAPIGVAENVQMDIAVFDYDENEYIPAAIAYSDVEYDMQNGTMCIKDFVNSGVPVTFAFDAEWLQEGWYIEPYVTSYYTYED